jgi:hypothetical protein
VLLLRQIERRLRLIERMDAALPDPRNQFPITHSQVSMLRQRIFAIAPGQTCEVSAEPQDPGKIEEMLTLARQMGLQAVTG